MYIVTPPRLSKLSTTLTILNTVSAEICSQKNSGRLGEIKGFEVEDLNRLLRANLYAVACSFGLQNDNRNQELKPSYDALIGAWKTCQVRAIFAKDGHDPDAHY